MQKKYGGTGKFTVFLSFVQRFNADAGTFLTQNARIIPVYEQIRLPHAPCGKGIPHAVLFDHAGNVVATGFPDELETKVAALVKAAPEPPPAILGGLDIKFCKSYVAPLAKGNPIDPILKRLNEMAVKDDDPGKEAKQLAEAVNKYVEKENARLKEASESAPARTLLDLNSFVMQVKGMACEQEARDLIAKLRKDKCVVQLSTAMQQVDTLLDKAAKNTKGSSRADDKALSTAKDAVRKMMADPKITEAVSKEAREFIQTF
ncbi:MAG: hypothetical protein WAX69_06860 [Victivallales bacterium]